MRSGGQGVSIIHNDYLTSKELTDKIRKKRRRGLIRRLMAFFILLSLTVGSLYSVVRTQEQKLVSIEQKKLQTEKSLAQVTSQQKELNRKIKLLNNKEYIGELARQKYFMSKKGEIIFTSPKTTGH